MKHLLNIQDITSSLKNREPISLSRFGDGEWNCIFGKEGSNCDGHDYFPDLGEELAEIIESQPDYHVGINWTDALKAKQFRWLWEREIPLYFDCTSEIFHNPLAGKEKGWGKFLEVLVEREDDIVIVGPHHFRGFPMKIFQHIVVPEKNCWEDRGKIMENIHRNIGVGQIILFAAGMPACVFINDLHSLTSHGNTYSNVSFIDIGSALDPLCGVQSRSFMRNLPI